MGLLLAVAVRACSGAFCGKMREANCKNYKKDSEKVTMQSRKTDAVQSQRHKVYMRCTKTYVQNVLYKACTSGKLPSARMLKHAKELIRRNFVNTIRKGVTRRRRRTPRPII